MEFYCANMAAEFGKPGVIEFGTSLGISTMYLASGCPGISDLYNGRMSGNCTDCQGEFQ